MGVTQSTKTDPSRTECYPTLALPPFCLPASPVYLGQKSFWPKFRALASFAFPAVRILFLRSAPLPLPTFLPLTFICFFNLIFIRFQPAFNSFWMLMRPRLKPLEAPQLVDAYRDACFNLCPLCLSLRPVATEPAEPAICCDPVVRTFLLRSLGW